MTETRRRFFWKRLPDLGLSARGACRAVAGQQHARYEEMATADSRVTWHIALYS